MTGGWPSSIRCRKKGMCGNQNAGFPIGAGYITAMTAGTISGPEIPVKKALIKKAPAFAGAFLYFGTFSFSIRLIKQTVSERRMYMKKKFTALVFSFPLGLAG